MEPFSDSHMALIRPWSNDPETQRKRLDRWITIAYPVLWGWTCGHLWAKSWSDEERQSALLWALEKLWDRIARKLFEDPPRKSDKNRYRAAWYNLLKDWVRSENSRRKREVVQTTESGTATIDLKADPNGISPEEALTSAEDAALRRRSPATDWRNWPTTAVNRLVVACREIPEEIRREDVVAAVDASKQASRSGLSRPADQTWELLKAWRMTLAERPSRRATQMLAFILRGDPETTDFEAQSKADLKRFEDWLYKRKERTLAELARKLKPAWAGFDEEPSE